MFIQPFDTGADATPDPQAISSDAPGLELDAAQQRALHRALLESEDRARRTADRLRVVTDLAADLLKPDSLERLDTVLRSAARRVIEHDVFTFALFDEESNALCFLAGWDGEVFEDGAVIPLSGTPSERVIHGRRSLLTSSAADPASAGALPFGNNRRSESVIRSPVISGDAVVGVISVQSYQPNRYTSEDVEVFEAIASLTATAMRNIRNVAEQQAMEAELRSSEERFRQVVDNIRGVFWLMDMPSRRLLYVSPAFQALWGRPLRAAQRRLDFVHQEDRALVDAALAAGAADTYDIQYRILRPDGTVRWIRDRAFAVAGAGEGVRRIAGIAEDITEDRQQQDQLRRAERLAAIGTMVGGVAHELNNPLQSIRGFTEMMLQEERSAADREALELIRREAARATRIVAELRLLARRSHEGPTHRSHVDVNDVVRHVLRMREYSLATHNIEVVQELAPQLPPVLGDAAQLEQVVMNLIVNAAHALADVERERRLVVCTQPHAGGCLLSVHDNGSGIARENLDRLFDPFFTTKPPGEGTGLGLPLAQKIVMEHGGTIHVESEAGVSTTFRVELPAAGPAAAAAHDAHDAHAATDRPVADGGPVAVSRRLRILIVDDEESIREMLRRAAVRRGHTADLAREGGEALHMLDEAAARGLAYDLIVSDLRMPGMNGRQLAERLRARATNDIDRLVLMTGDVADDWIAAITATTAVRLLNKPFSLAEIDALLAHREHAG